MNYEFKTTFIGNNSCELNNSIVEDGWNDTSESETIDELPRLSVSSSDCNITSRRVSFPKSDSDLVTGYLEPANPWESASEVTSIKELKKLYEESCKKHRTEPLTIVLNHIETLELNKTERHASFNLKDTELTPESCEALEEIFKRVQYEFIDLSACKLNDVAGSALFDMIEYYEATNELDISDNPGILTRGWQSCISMIRRSKALQNLAARGIVLSELNATNLGKSLNQSCLHTIKLEHCGLTGRPLASLCNSLRKNTTLRELWIAYNDLSDIDAEKLADLLKANAYLEFLDISNNHLKDNGVKQIVIALIEQSTILQIPNDEIELNVSNNNNNNNVLSEIGSSILCSESNDTFTEITDNENSFTNDIPLALSSSLTKNSQNVGRSMLDTLLNMNTKETDDNSAVNLEIPLINLNNNNDDDNNDQNENEIKKMNTISDTMNTRVDCLIKRDTCEIKDFNCGEDGSGSNDNSGIVDGGGNIQDDNSSTISGSLTPTPPFNLDSSFSDEKSNENDFLVQNEKRINENESFKTNNNLIPYDQQQNQQNDLSSSIPPSLSLDTSLHQISSSTILDVNDNSKTLEEFDSNSTDSAFESASEGDTKIFAEDFSKSNYIKMISSSSVHQETDQYQKNTNNDDDDECNEKNQKEEQQQLFQQQEQSQQLQLQQQIQKQQQEYEQLQMQSEQQKQQQQEQQKQQMQHFESKSELTDTKESINCSIVVNSESNTIISSEIRNRSLSSDSLSSENSIDLSTDNSQLSKMNEKLTKNDTLTRQKHNDQFLISIKKPRGLQALILWNNDITKDSAEYVADLLDSTNSLELLNIGKNILSNDFLRRIKNSLQRNTTVSNLGLQSTHLNSEGIKILAEILGFGGNKTLQRIDIRDNNVQVEGLTALSEALKSNNTVTRIDIDDVPKRIPDDGNETQFHYSRMLHTVRSLCSRNQKSQEMPPSTANNVKISRNYMSSRKISLTCQSLRTPLPDVLAKNELGLSDTVRKRSGTRLRSPLPSPPTISPSSSPVPSPSRNRFQVLRVNEKAIQSDEASSVEESPTIIKQAPKPRFSRFKVTIIENSSLKPNENKPPIKINSSSIAVNTEEKHKENSAEQNNLNTVNEQKVIESVDKIDLKATNSQKIPLELDDKKLISILPETSNVEIQTTDEKVDDRTKDIVDATNDKSKADSLKIEEKPVKDETKETELEENIACTVDGTSSVDQIEPNTQATSESELTNEMKTSPLKETSNIPSETKLEGIKSTENTENRTRRVSWISSGNYPATVDKLLNLFQHPGNLFARSTSPDHDKKIDDNEISSQSLVPLRKQSPPSLFQWHKAQTSDIKRISSDNMLSANLQSYVRGITDFGKQVFKQNVSFMDNTMPVADAQQQQQQEDCKSIPTDIKKEIKENISPEHTVTKNSIVSFQSVSSAQKMIDMSSREAIDKGTENIQTAADTTTSTTATSTSLESAELCNISRQQQQQQQQQEQTQQQNQHHHQKEQQLTGICDVRNEKQ